ncbi:hypothetical protein F5880DRAFT_1616913 [Lentinula raphanica]|nr:hypothetical protein F5880DRAFT_1616913 [Lentinula raphanica]
MDPEYQVPPQESGTQPHPYLHEPLLYISNLPSTVSDESLGMAFMTCAPFRPKIARDNNAEKALATLQSRPLPGVPDAHLMLSPYPPTNPPTPLPPPSALPRLVKHLSINFGDSAIYDLLRPFGALASVRITTHHFGVDTGMIEFWNEDDARCAEEAMHCADVEGQNIAVQVYQLRRAASGTVNDFKANAPTFVPSGSVFGYSSPTTYSPPGESPRQQVQLAPLSGPGSNRHSGLIDPCNLFCKNLDPDINSNASFSHFHQFGQIVSFVSHHTSTDQAAAAMHGMNNITLGAPNKLFGGNGHPRSASGATSPTASEGGDSYGAGEMGLWVSGP